MMEKRVQLVTDAVVTFVAAHHRIHQRLPFGHGYTAFTNAPRSHGPTLVICGAFEIEDPKSRDTAQLRHLRVAKQFVQGLIGVILQGPERIARSEALLSAVIALNMSIFHLLFAVKIGVQQSAHIRMWKSPGVAKGLSHGVCDDQSGHGIATGDVFHGQVFVDVRKSSHL